jgi:hypothetical protein
MTSHTNRSALSAISSGWVCNIAVNWTIEPPKDGEAIDPQSGWVRARPSLAGGGAQLHFKDGWRP